MTRRHDTWKALREIAEVRSLQTKAAESRAALAARNANDKEAVRQQAESRRANVEESWRGALNAKSLSIELAEAWSVALLQEDARVVRAVRDCDDDAASVSQRAMELHRARTLQDVADEMAQKARRACSRQLEESRLADSADHDLQRRYRR
jgi:hypothetical protein